VPIHLDEGFIGVMSAGAAPAIENGVPVQQPVYQQEPLPTPAEAAAIRTTWRQSNSQVDLLSRIALHPEVAADDPWNFVFSRIPNRIGPLGLAAHEETAIWSWGQSIGLAKIFDPRDPTSTLELLRNLLTVRIDVDRPEARPTITALSGLGILPAFTTRMVSLFEAELGKKPIPDKVHFHYNGHLNPEILSSFIALDVLGMESASISRSNQSGTPPIPKILESRLTNASAFGSLERYRTWRTLPSIAPFPDQPDRTLSIFDRMRESVARGETFIIDKMSDLFGQRDGGGGAHPDKRAGRGPIPSDVMDAMLAGKVRLIVHNRNDRDALDKIDPALRKRLYGADLSSSRIKAFEADVIGEQYILEAARDVREQFGTRLMDTPVVVVGHGLLGSGLTRALVRLGYPADQIYVRDLDQAKQGGFAKIDGRRLENAVVFVATPGAGVNAEDLGKFAKRSLVYSITSGGRGIDLDSLRTIDPSPGVVRTRVGGHDFERNAPRSFDDLRFQLPGSETIIAGEGQQVNLIRQAWWERQNAVTGGGGGLNQALVIASRRTESGIVEASNDPLWSHWESESLRAIRELDLHRIRPLVDPNPDVRRLLELDLQQFPNYKSYTSFTAS
jgi:hypothetical protein